MKLFKKDLKISKKTVIIAALIVILLGLPALAYLWINNQENTVAWYDSHWLYRRAIIIEHEDKGELVNHHYLLELDTSSLISAGKLKNDCSDLRFLDSNDSTLLDYWIESGCNTTLTEIWILIPSLLSPKTIYMYYGNPSASTGELSWSGNFIILSNASCPTGWTRNTDFDNKFPYGSNRYFISLIGISALHLHTASLVSSTNSDTDTVLSSFFTEMYGVNHDHTHTVSVITDQEEVLPPYIDMIFCQKNKLDLETNFVTGFNSSTLPTGWERFTELDTRFPRGSDTYGNIGGVEEHTHGTEGMINEATISGPSAIGPQLPADDGSDAYLTTSHTHTVSSATVGTANNMPPYYTLNYAITQNVANLNKSHYMLMITTDTPPLGWTFSSPLQNNFALGSAIPTLTGGSATHSHSISLTLSSAINTKKLSSISARPNNFIAHDNHTHTASGTTATASNIPPHVEVMYFQRNEILTTTSIGDEETNNHPPDAPSLLETEGETNPIGVINMTPSFSAIFTDPDTTDTAIYYQIEVNTSSNFLGIDMWNTGKQSIGPITNGARSPLITYAGTPLSMNGVTYYWRIKFWDNHDLEGDWSSTASFSMNNPPNAPTSLETEGETNPLKVYNLTPNFTAICSDVDGDSCVSYQVMVQSIPPLEIIYWDSGKQNFASPVMNNTRSPNIAYAGSTLSLDGVTRYWRIKFWDENNLEGDWSSTGYFTMSGNPYPPSSLLVDTITNPVVPLFSAVHTDPNQDNATHYEIHVNSSPFYSGTIMWESGKQSMSATPHNSRSPNIAYAGTPLTDTGNTYYWRIRFWDVDDNVSSWSLNSSFIDSIPLFRMEGIKLEGISIN
jgi:hypothetical protein